MNSNFKKYTVIVFALFISAFASAQEKYILKGTVLNSSKDPVNNVSIRIPGGAGPVYSDSTGAFSLEIEKDSTNWLVVRPSQGYGEKYFLLSQRDSIVVYLSSEDLKSGFDEISLPTQDVRRQDMVSSFNTFEASEFQESGYSNVQQYLQGKLSGAFITSNSGMPGTGASTFIRGYSSLLTNNQPLYIVDGVPLEDAFFYDEMLEGYEFDPLSAIDPQDISEVTVLKDAAATAIYGMKGANGVVYIKTLEPKETKTIINLSLKTGLTQKPKYFKQLNADQYKNLANEVLFSSGESQENIEDEYPGLYYNPDEFEHIIYNHNTNWQDEVYQNALMQNLRFSIKGGDEIARYGLSVGYMNSEGVFNNTDLDRYNIRLVGAFNVFSWLKMNVNSSLATSTSLVKESALSATTSPILSSLFKSPLLNPYVYDSEGNLLKTIDEVKEFGVSNPTAVSGLMDAKVKNYRFLTSIRFEGDLGKNLKLKSIIGLNSNNLKEFVFVPDQGFDLMFNEEAYNVTRAQNDNYLGFYNDNQLSFSTADFSKAYKVTANIGYKWQTNKYEEDWGIGKNTPSDDYQYLQRGSSLIRELGGRNKNWNWASLYANAALTFKEKYIASISASGDLSSRIGENASGALMIGDAPVGTFYSVGGAWRLSNENFLNSIDEIEEIKLRASWGKSGNDDVGEVNGVKHYVYDHYRLTSVLVPGITANNELTYQQKEQLNVGLDLSFYANRISLTADYFNNKSSNILLYSDIYNTIGFNSYPVNSASLSTKGFELNMFGRVFDRNDLCIDLGLNFSKYTTLIDELAEGDNIYEGAGGMELINRENEQINSYYGYVSKGVFTTSEQAAEANLVSAKGVAYKAGDAWFEDVNNDNIIDDNDKQLLGSFEPEFFGGFAIDVKYKHWSLNTLFQGVYGNEIFNYVRYENEKMTDLSNQSVKVLQRWQYEGQNTDVPKAMWGDPAGNNDFSDRWIEDGSYLRLKNITLSYEINQSMLFFKRLKVYATASNVFTLSKYLGFDPENSYSSDLRHQGMDYGVMPTTRQFLLGVNIGM